MPSEPAADIPQCHVCHRVLTRIDHVSTEYLILDASGETAVYRPLDCEEGLASDTGIRCGFCGSKVGPEDRQFFYERWWQVVEYNRRVKEFGP